MRGNARCFSVAIFLRVVRDTGAMRFRRLCQEAAVAVYVILCQLRRAPLPDAPEWVFRDESYELITNMLGNEQNP